MIVTKFDLVLFIIFHVSRCERRIVDGELLKTEKTYVVYLLKATMSERTYDSWLCSGAIVSAEFIITSAACVENVRFMYAIAGYNRYVTDKEIEHDPCTTKMKKKIVYTCVPVSYELDSNKIGKRGYIDIALAKVESPYNFKDKRYETICSYTPSIIPINIDAKLQEAGVNAMVLGWGHTKYWRQLGDHKNYNQEYLHYGTTTLLDKHKCQYEYKNYPNLVKTIEKYMICSYDAGRGRLNEQGMPYSKNCITQKENLTGLQGVLCKGVQIQKYGVDKTRKNIMNLKQTSNENVNETDIMNRTDIMNITGTVNGTGIVSQTGIMNRSDIVNGTSIMNRTRIVNPTSILNGTGIMHQTGIVNQTGIMNGTGIVNPPSISNRTDSIDSTDFIKKSGFGNTSISSFYNITDNRRNGICQNDHGGPLVTWVDNKEVLIGVASIFRIADDRKCIGPFLYSSTLYNGGFIGCVLNDERVHTTKTSNENKFIRNFLSCDSPPIKKGYDIIEKYLSWKDHPAGPADNERASLRLKKQNISKATSVESDSENVNPLNHTQKTQQVSSVTSPPSVMEHLSVITSPPKIDRLSIINRPPETDHLLIIRPTPIIRPPPVMDPSPIKIPPLEMDHLSITRPPPKMGGLSKIQPLPEMDNWSVIRLLPESEPPPIIRPPPEIDHLSIIRPPPKMDGLLKIGPLPEIDHLSVIRLLPESEPPSIIRSPPEMDGLPIIRPVPELEPPPIIRPSPIKSPPPEIDNLSVIRLLPESEPPPIIRPPPEIYSLSTKRYSPIKESPPEMEPLPITRPTPKANLPPMLSSPLEVEPGPSKANPITNKVYSILDFQSDESFLKEVIFGIQQNFKTTTQNNYIQPEIKIRLQRPLYNK